MIPESMEMYYFVRSTGDVGRSLWRGEPDDLMRWKCDNCFESYEEASEFASHFIRFFRWFAKDGKKLVQAGFLKRQPSPCFLSDLNFNIPPLQVCDISL